MIECTYIIINFIYAKTFIKASLMSFSNWILFWSGNVNQCKGIQGFQLMEDNPLPHTDGNQTVPTGS